MKIQRFNEGNFSEKQHNYTRYRVVITHHDEEVLNSPSQNFQDALENYNSYVSIKNLKRIPNRKIYLIKETSEILTDQDIELLSNANKYNL